MSDDTMRTDLTVYYVGGWLWLERLVGLRVLGVRPLLPLAELVYQLSLPLGPRLARLIARRRH